MRRRSILRWRQAPLEQLEEVRGPWGLVAAAPLFEQLPSLRQKALGERAVLAFPEGAEPLLVLRLPRSWAALDGHRFLAERVEPSRVWVLAMQVGQGGLPEGPARLEWREGWPEVRWGESRLGSACHPLARDWAWAWSPTYGPVILRVYLRASAAEITAWVESRCPGVWSGGISRWSKDCRLRAVDGCLTLSRGYHQAPLEQVDADYFLLMDLARGSLGELEFDLFDGDYHRFVASGYSCESFGHYLHARARRGKSHAWNRFRPPATIEAVATDLDGTAARIAEALGWEPLGLEGLLARLALTRVRELPRNLQIEIRGDLWSEELGKRFLEAQPRMIFTWRLA